jgi:hypothetical protein
MPNQPTSFTAQPPPPVPAGAVVSEILGNYLRNFSLWTRNGFASKLDVSSAAPGILLLSPGGLAFRITVDDTGALKSVQVPLGGGKP